jgi:predicted kinase
MRTIYLTKGLPGSGKSTWAKGFVFTHEGSVKRVSKDDLRSMLDSSKWTGSNEKFILRLRDHIVKETLRSGKHIIVDDTNLHSKHEKRMKAIIDELKEEGITCQLKIKDFTDVSIEACIERDLIRPNSVGEKVIKRMYCEFLKQDNEERKQVRAKDPSLPNCIIVDIDGTLANRTTRSPFEWDKVGEDTVKEDIARIVQRYKNLSDYENEDLQVFIFSGREDVCFDVTAEWLRDNHIPFDTLVLRKAGDHRKDSIVKREMFEKHIEDKYNVLFVLDDRKQVVDMWRNELNLTCLQVEDNNF